MSPSDQIPRILLQVRAADRGTEIFLMDARLNRIKTAIGEMHEEVVPGLYKIRFRSGGTMQDHLVEVPTELPPGQTAVLVYGPPLQFSSAMPLTNTRTSHEYHQAAWSRASMPPDIHIGSGAFLFVLARDPEKLPGRATSHRPWHGLSLHSIDNTNRALGLDFSDAPYRNEDLGVAAVQLEVNPGTYLLRVDTGLWGIREMAVHASAGWQTQIFLSSSSWQRTRYGSQKSYAEPPRTYTTRRVDLNSAAVLMVRPGNIVNPSDPQWRLTELARQGLAQNRDTVRADDLRDMLWAKFDNPMLGVFGAALMLRSESSSEFLQEVVENLTTLLPDHPDVAVLRLAVGLQDRPDVVSQHSFPLPPMLLENWKRLIQASIEIPERIPIYSPAAVIGGSYYSEGPWLVWQHSREVARAFQVYQLWEQEIPASNIVRMILHGFGKAFTPHVGISQSLEMSAQPQSFSHQLALTSSDILLPQILNELSERTNLISIEEAGLTDKLTPIQFALIRELEAASKVTQGDRVAWLMRNLGIPRASLEQTARKLLSTNHPRRNLPTYDEVHVISDIHMGGSPGFQILLETQRLANYIRWVAAQCPEGSVALVLNGGLFDTLAEDIHGYVVVDEAIDAVARIMHDASFCGIWDALRNFVNTDRRTLVIVIGNHDIEIALPSVQRLILLRLGLAGDDFSVRARIEFSTTVTGYTCIVGVSRVFCTHGSEFDAWSYNRYDYLAKVARHINAGHSPDLSDWLPCAVIPMIEEVMNNVKPQYPWIGLLKPVTAATTGILIALVPSQITTINKLLSILGERQRGTKQVDQRLLVEGFQPREQTGTQAITVDELLGPNMRAVLNGSKSASAQSADDQLLATENSLKQLVAPLKAPLDETLSTGGYILDRLTNLDKIEVLRAALKDWLAESKSFDITDKDDTYKQVMASVDASTDFIVTGHTHLERAIEVRGGRYYFNCGTWIPRLHFTETMLKDLEAFRPVYYLLVDRHGRMDEIVWATFPDASGEKKAFAQNWTGAVSITLEGGKAVGRLIHVEVEGDGTIKGHIIKELARR